MQKTYHITRASSASELGTILFNGLVEEASLAKGMTPIHPFNIAIVDEDNIIVGGATGIVYYGCLYVDMLWVNKELRHQGWATKLMQEAEEIGREHHATFATVNTMDFEALPFYEKIGYTIEFTRTGYDKKSKMFMLRKSLSAEKSHS